MDERVRRLKTPEDCEQFAKNVAVSHPGLAQEARRRAVELRAITHGAQTEVEREALQAVYAYEEVLSQKRGKKTRATRTWQMIKRHGIIEAVQRAVNRNDETMGYIALLETGMQDFAFEFVVLKYPEHFGADTVARARARIGEWGRA